MAGNCTLHNKVLDALGSAFSAPGYNSVGHCQTRGTGCIIEEAERPKVCFWAGLRLYPDFAEDSHPGDNSSTAVNGN